VFDGAICFAVGFMSFMRDDVSELVVERVGYGFVS